MSGFQLKLGLFLLCVAVLVGVVVFLVWRNKKRAAQARFAELTAYAQSLGGTAEVGQRPWSADLTGAMASEYGTFLKWMGRQSAPRFDYALDFRRDGWGVRVTEASMEAATSTSTTTVQETRIEVATPVLVPLKIIRRRYVGGGLFNNDPERKWAGEMPVTVARGENPLWMEVRLPASVDHGYVAFTSDLAEAAGVLNHGVFEVLDQALELRDLTFEAGVAYTVLTGPIMPKTTVKVVDAIVALLERVPGAQQEG